MKARQNARVISRTSKLRPLGWVIIKERRGAGSLIPLTGGWVGGHTSINLTMQ